jgi:MFS family permease
VKSQVYLLRQNFAIAQIGYIFSLFVIGGLLATVPLTHLADRLGRLKIVLFCTCIVVISIIGLAVNTNAIALPILVFIAGASMSPIFPLSLALIGEKLPVNEIIFGKCFIHSYLQRRMYDWAFTFCNYNEHFGWKLFVFINAVNLCIFLIQFD